MIGSKSEAWATCALNDEQVAKALVLANSLKRSSTNRSIVVLVSPSVSSHLRNALGEAFHHKFILEEDRNEAGLKPDEFVKLFALTLHGFDKILFLWPSMIVLRNSDELFEIPNGDKQSFVCMENMDTSILLLKPSLDVFRILTAIFRSRNGSGVEKILRNWTGNQTEMPVYIHKKYNRKVNLGINGNGTLLGNERNIFIANMQQLPKEINDVCKLVLANQNNMLQNSILKHWLSIYEEDVKPLLYPPSITSPSNSQLMLSSCAASTPLNQKEPIAIVGMSCRYPSSKNLEEFWNLIFNGEDGTCTPPPFRWQREQCARNRPDCRNTNAGFLSVPVDEFDAKFFGLSPKEALGMDPQHRLLHELVWEGLEDAAIDPLKLRGTNGGVFMGSWLNDFKAILEHGGHSDFYRLYMGSSIGAASARISFLLGLTGPAVSTESGCSSAMVAVHMACKSLRNGETNMALACGVNLLLHPFDKEELPMMVSPDGHSKTFDAKADGFARAEGCGVLVLKRLSDALKDNDHIWALIRGTGLSQEGVSRSMGTPTVHCEALAMEQALADAQVEPAQVSYVEAHGTGTVVGDPMEVSAIAQAYSKNRIEPLIIGSVKTNVGHTESCSGITGIMKVVLAMHHETIPPHRNFETLNPAIDLEAVPAQIPLKPMAWPRNRDKPRLSGVSSFGITGTDAHAILEEAPVITSSWNHPLKSLAMDSKQPERPLHLLKISAKTEEALDLLVERWQECLETCPESLSDICYTANIGRADFDWRATLIATSKQDLLDKLKGSRVLRKEANENEAGKICFLFTGQGSQYPGMGKELYESSPVFRLHFDYCESIMKQEYNINLKQVLWPSSNSSALKEEVSRTIYSQTAIFCVEYALLRLWESLGVKPDYALGHSLGEFAAAVCAGILRPEDAIKLVAERSRLIDELPRGKMLVLKADKATVHSKLTKFSKGKELDYAAINSTQQTVVAGDSDLVLEFAKICSESGIKNIVLESTHAFHSKHMDPILDEYRGVAQTISEGDEENQCEYISGMRGSLLKAENVNAEYWVAHTREKVRFLEASRKAVELGCQIFIEVGPQPVLSTLTMMNNDQSSLLCVPSLKKTEQDWSCLLGSLSKLYLQGVSIDWQGLDQFCNRKKIRGLPHYPFMRKKFWPDLFAATGVSIHPLLGTVLQNASSTKLFQAGLNLRALEWVKDHSIGTNVIFPGAGYLEMCLAAGHATVQASSDSFSHPTRPIKVENLRIEAPLCLLESKTCQVQVVVDFNTENGASDWNDLSVKIFHRVERGMVSDGDQSAKWLCHAQSTFTPLPTSRDKHVAFDKEKFLATLLKPSNEGVILEVYDKLASIGLKFGPIFRSLEKVWKSSESLLAKVKIPSGEGNQQYIAHPVILDAMIQAVMMHKHTDNLKKKLFVPIKIGKFVWLSSLKDKEDLYIEAASYEAGVTSALLLDETGEVLASMSDVELIDTTVKAVESVLEHQTTSMPDLWEETWRPKLGPMQKRIKLEENLSFYSKEVLENPLIFNDPTPQAQETFAEVEEFVYYNTLGAFYDMGWKINLGEEVTLSNLSIQLGIKDEFRNFFGFLFKILESRGILRRSGETTWKLISNAPTMENVKTYLISTKVNKDLVTKFYPTLLLGKIGEKLCNILRGSHSALSVLFPDEKMGYPSVAIFYEDYAEKFQLVDSVRHLLRSRFNYWKENSEPDSGSVLRILEVGAGTGVFTKNSLEILEELGIKYEYTYTDISQAFFPAAEKKFEKYVNKMKFMKLNVEEDPMTQGFVPEYYDYAIASDVIHATKNIRDSLLNVRMLLRKNGSFDIMEQTKVNQIISYTFGLMEGFWRFDDLDLRRDHCTISQEEWEEVAKSAGFGVTGMIPFLNHFHSYMSFQKVETQSNALESSSNRCWILFNEEKEATLEYIGRKLEGCRRKLIRVSDAKAKGFQHDSSNNSVFLRGNVKSDFEKMMEWISSRNLIVEGVIYGWSLDKRRTSQEELLQPYFHLVQAVISLKQKIAPCLICLTKGIAPLGDQVDLSNFHASTLWGFTKALANEHTDLNCRCIAINVEDEDIEEGKEEERFQELVWEIWNEEKELQVAYSGATRYIPKLQPLRPQTNVLSLPPGTDRFQLVLPETKSLSDLAFGQLDTFVLDGEEVEVQVKASALNFKDLLNILKPTEEFKDSNAVGFDFAGVVKGVGPQVSMWKVGDPVFGVNINGNALPNHIKMPQQALISVPSNLTFCEAATLPAVFATAYHCLIDVAKLKRGETVLIHTASGGVGLSAIQLCKHIGANVIATAGSRRKRAFLKSLGIKHIFHSRNTDYSQQILEVTKGQGVHVVLNSLTSEGFKEATIKACAKNARFVEMSKLNIWSPDEMKTLRPDISYTIVDLTKISDKEWSRLMENLSLHLSSGTASPIPYVRYDAVAIKDALNYLQKAKHIGKVVCVMPEFKLSQGQLSVSTPMFNERSSYLITGGLGGIGLEVGKWMIQSGAKHVLLASRSPPNASTKAVIEQLNKEEGAHILAVQLDVGNKEECRKLLSSIKEGEMLLPPLRGVMHAAGTLSDGLIANQEWPKLSSTFNTKINGTLSLHELTLGYPLEHFVVFSSIASLFGSPGQSNHAAGNNFEDTFTHYRHSIGLPATSINWGQWGQVGVATEVDLPGLKALSTLQGITALEYVLKTQRTQTCVLNTESFLIFSKLSPSVATYLDERIWKSANSGGGIGTSLTIKSDEFWQQYDNAITPEEKGELLKVQLRNVLRNILKLDESEVVGDNGNFQEMGVDSLMFVEIKNAVQALLGNRVVVSASALRDCNNVQSLADILVDLIDGKDLEEVDDMPPTPEEVFQLMREDCQLPQEIGGFGKEAKAIGQVKSVLLTGVTGNLGPYILRELSNLPQITQIYCLVRTKGKEDCPVDRVRKWVTSKEIGTSVDWSKIEGINGDVTLPQLGMKDEDLEKLRNEVDAVFHCAVRADHTQLYKKRNSTSGRDVRIVNIEGTKNVLRFACEGNNLKHVYHASSLLAVAVSDEDGTFSENWPKLEDYDGIGKNAYPISKFIGDMLMKEAVKRGIPCKVFRFPLIAGDSETGRVGVEQNHLLLRYLYILKTGMMPESPFPIGYIPVDVCAQVSTQIFFNEEAPSSEIFNVTHPQPALDQEFSSLAEKLGYKVNFVELSQFTQKLKDESGHSHFAMFKDFYKRDEELVAHYTSSPILSKWAEGAEDFWVSKKLQKLVPSFAQSLEGTMEVLERDILFAKKQGWFQKMGL